MRFVVALIGLLSASIGQSALAQPKGPLVLAAASLQESMTEAADTWAKAGHPRPVVSFAASSALARQVQAGAPADLFASADEDWMNTLQAKGLIVTGTRADWLTNRLVIIAPAKWRGTLPMNAAALVRVLGAGPLAMADPDAIPAGKYGKAALTAFGAWPALAPHVVRGDSVRAALALVERGGARFGIVYATDARASTSVRIIGVFPAKAHPPIVYPLARLIASRHRDAEGFRRFLLSARGKAIFARHGFTPR
jgi:molybdate transport system substrate-binding protein